MFSKFKRPSPKMQALMRARYKQRHPNSTSVPFAQVPAAFANAEDQVGPSVDDVPQAVVHPAILAEGAANANVTVRPNHAGHFDGPMAEKVFEDSNIKLLVRKVDFARQKNFALTDHLYALTLQRKEKSAEFPLAISVTHAIYEAIEKILAELKSFYGGTMRQSLDRYCIITFISNDLESALNTPVFKLSDSIDSTMTEFRSRLENCLQSFQSMRLDESFRINLKIVGLDHMATKQIGLSNGALYAGVPPIHLKHSFILPVPRGYANHEDAFHNRCLPLSIILGLYATKGGQERDPKFHERWCQMATICGRGQQSRTRNHDSACKILHETFQSLCLQQGGSVLDDEAQDTEKICKFFSDKFNVNVILHVNDLRDSIHYSYPPKFDNTMARLDLHGVIDGIRKSIHFGAITALQSYKAEFSLRCMLCNKLKSSKGYIHKCPNFKT